MCSVCSQFLCSSVVVRIKAKMVCSTRSTWPLVLGVRTAVFTCWIFAMFFQISCRKCHTKVSSFNALITGAVFVFRTAFNTTNFVNASEIICGCDHTYFSQTAPSDLYIFAGVGVVSVHHGASYPQIFHPSPCNNILYMRLCTLLYIFSYGRTRRCVVLFQEFRQYRRGLYRPDIIGNSPFYDKVCFSAK